MSNAARRIAERKLWRNGLLGSVVVHLFVFFLWWGTASDVSPFAAAGPRAGDNRAASGGMQSVTLRIPPPRPIIPPRIPLPTLDPVQLDDMQMEEAIEMASILGDRPGDAEGPGLLNGDGLGDGGTAADGLFRLVPPSPRGMIIPPANRGLRGQEVEVWVFVNEAGRVVADSTHLRPPTSDGDFNDRLLREAAQWSFAPARQGGEAVGSWFPYTITR